MQGRTSAAKVMRDLLWMALAAMVNLASSIAHVRAGRMKVLATTWPTRNQG